MSRPAEAALDLLRQAGRVVCDADPGNDTDTLRRVMFLVESARVALATDAAPTTPSRPAEEIAREMVTGAIERFGGDWGFTVWARGTDGRDVDLTVDGYMREESAERDSQSLRATIAAAIEQARAEGAAAERERIFAAASGKPADLAVVAMAAEGMRGEADYARDRIAEIERRRARLDEAQVARQPSDLAGRIRALVQEYAGRWADADRSDSEMRQVMLEVMRILRLAMYEMREGRAPWSRVEELREPWSARFNDIMRKAADELEAIVRDAGGR